ncbi:MAG: Tim44 domain-containing protein [Methylococcaceae bacterium]|nr:MAG: Tim44 domain-containing protein [Methylococcaceae bacterium]
MNHTAKIYCLSLIIACCLALAGPAEAARFGGGKSFGGKPSFSAPYKRSVDSPAATLAPQRAAPAPGAMQTPQRSGMWGMLGGLALGGLLGSMLFGGGFQGINFMDIVLFAGLAFLAFKLMAAWRGRPQPVTANQAYARNEAPADILGQQRSTDIGAGAAGFDTDILSRKSATPMQQAVEATPSIPADFDLEGFLAGAKNAYRHLQTAWDQGELAEIRGLTTDKVFAEIQEQLRARQGGNQTEILKLEAELLEVRDREQEREVSVLFDVMMRETDDEHPRQVREVWHFIRSRLSRQPTWFLDGIQQLDD